MKCPCPALEVMRRALQFLIRGATGLQRAEQKRCAAMHVADLRWSLVSELQLTTMVVVDDP